MSRELTRSELKVDAMPRIRRFPLRTLVAVLALLALISAYAQPSRGTPAGSQVPASESTLGTLHYRLAANGDLVIILDPQDPDVGVALLADVAEEIQNAHPLLSDTVHEMLDLAVVPVPNCLRAVRPAGRPSTATWP
jgi:hypothetical protein